METNLCVAKETISCRRQCLNFGGQLGFTGTVTRFSCQEKRVTPAVPRFSLKQKCITEAVERFSLVKKMQHWLL